MLLYCNKSLSYLKWNFHVLMWPLFSSHAVFLLTFFLMCVFALSLFIHFVLLFILDNYLVVFQSITLSIYSSLCRYLLFLSTSSITLSSPVYFLLFLSPLYSNLLVATYQSVVSYCWLLSSFIISYIIFTHFSVA